MIVLIQLRRNYCALLSACSSKIFALPFFAEHQADLLSDALHLLLMEHGMESELNAQMSLSVSRCMCRYVLVAKVHLKSLFRRNPEDGNFRGRREGKGPPYLSVLLLTVSVYEDGSPSGVTSTFLLETETVATFSVATGHREDLSTTAYTPWRVESSARFIFVCYLFSSCKGKRYSAGIISRYSLL